MLEPTTLALLLLAGFFVLLIIGIPVAISLAVSGFVFGWLGFGNTLFSLLPARFFGVVGGYQWMAIPLFVFMGVMLEKSRLADDLLDVMGHLAGRVRGGMPWASCCSACSWARPPASSARPSSPWAC